MNNQIPVYIVTDPNAKPPPFACGHVPQCTKCDEVLWGDERAKAYDDCEKSGTWDAVCDKCTASN